ncbi:MAG: ABC transporter substrate-binding protein [Microbacterium gubbeenense]|uniref:ABC transporter substrate-binding protein n=1 Tax=Microbacterium gubbeenense TaxID=159896 RepID=UPI003F9E0896
MTARRALSVLAAAAAVLVLSACGGAPLPSSVVEDSSVDVAWRGALTSVGSPVSTGDDDVSQLTHAQFARLDQGTVVEDRSFGRVKILDESDSAMTVRYDLEQPSWSDGIPLDSADLMLAWAAGAHAGDDGFEIASSGLVGSRTPTYDEFERSIDVTFDGTAADWQTALQVVAPAHVVGRIAFGIDDPMAAKQAVIQAVENGDLDEIASAFNSAFEVSARSPVGEDRRLASGPYVVERIDGDAEAGDQVVTLVSNREFQGEVAGAFERIVFRQDRSTDVIDHIGDEYDVAQLPVSQADFVQVRDLERDDYGMATVGSGRIWTLLARADTWPLQDIEARTAFLRTIPRSDIIAAAAGDWTEAYEPISAMTLAPGDNGYEIAVEDGGLEKQLELAQDPAAMRKSAGVPENTVVCILYDTDSAFARSAFETMSDALDEGGWTARDCGNASPEEVIAVGGAYDAVLTTIDVPETPADIARQWGAGDGNPTHATSKERDALIERLGTVTDSYERRDVRVAIETDIVSQRVAVPIAADPVVIVASRDVETVQGAPGRHGALASDPLEWVPEGAGPPAAG